MTGPWFHGGVPGLQVGDVIECPDVHGSSYGLAAWTPSGSTHGTRSDVVYVTTIQNEARVFAAFYPDGALYRVEPIDTVGPDPDSPDTALMCRRARIDAVLHPVIRFQHRTFASWRAMLLRGA